MPLVTTGALVTRAAAARAAVAAFNIITWSTSRRSSRAPSPSAHPSSSRSARTRSGSATDDCSRSPARRRRRTGRRTVALHLDHVQSDALLRQAPDAGFSSVMYDASRLPYQENLAATRAAADWAHAQGLWIEAELGEVGGKDGRPPLDAHAPGARTDPAEARAFVTDSGVDALAVAIGSTHAMTTRTATLDHALLKRLSGTLDVPLVLHGSSGPDDELTAAVAGGITKVNVGTALNIAMTGAIREFLTAHPQAVDSRSYLSVGREAMARAVARIITTLRRPTTA
ncbi:class II fructose-bisphosphate aldolase [Streptomyces sp. F001]|uniref:class II fructose-bisphosphate aldolase n=1 Tax=Streptomyces sp. F001 TaxID=1510026 RepID=UPI0013EEC4FA|nr:class II fructose-bisphosphate aldolase [Streptomyces sp. F001]